MQFKRLFLFFSGVFHCLNTVNSFKLSPKVYAITLNSSN